MAVAVAVTLLAAIRVGVAVQLAIGIKALPSGKADTVGGADFAVGGGAGLRAALFIQVVRGAADQLVAAVGLFIASQLAVCVVCVLAELVTGAVGQCVLFFNQASHCIVAVGSGVVCRVDALSQVACGVVAVLDGAAQRAGFFNRIALGSVNRHTIHCLTFNQTPDGIKGLCS